MTLRAALDALPIFTPTDRTPHPVTPCRLSHARTECPVLVRAWVALRAAAPCQNPAASFTRSGRARSISTTPASSKITATQLGVGRLRHVLRYAVRVPGGPDVS